MTEIPESSIRRIMSVQEDLTIEAQSQIDNEYSNEPIHEVDDFPVKENRNYFDIKHNAAPCPKEESVYQALADFEHNELPISYFITDFIMDDPRFMKLVVDCLKRKFSGFYDEPNNIGENMIDLVSDAFHDYSTLEDEDGY